MTLTQLRADLARLRNEGSAATAIEYAMIAALIGLALLSLQYTIGASVVQFFMNVGNGL
jgi:Flp pilus assembly pilin Flp